MRREALCWTGLLTAVALSLVTGFVVTVLAGGGRDSSTPLRALAHPASLANRLTIVMTPAGRRTALVHRPPHHGPTAALVVVLHGANSSGERTQASLGWDQLADRDSFVVAYPNGIGHFWNAGNCCGPAHRLHVDDVQFLHDLRTQLVIGDHVDPHRVYAVGFSNGAMMAYAWACGRPDDLAGIGVVAGALVTRCDPAPALPVVAIHGTADRNVPIHGGVGPRSVSHYRYPSLEESLTPFRAANHCATTPKTTDRPPVRKTTWVRQRAYRHDDRGERSRPQLARFTLLDAVHHKHPHRSARLHDPVDNFEREPSLGGFVKGR